ncbi:MAG TPA: FadR/GntR family transcriptional regulator [Negativicutes bacterium]|jgi:DNA-binding FadR family transcriptional regulator
MIEKKNLSEIVADQITSLINEKYFEGNQVPNETEFAKQLNVSRTTIREAIKLLCSKNILEIRRGKGTFVCASPGMSEDPLGYRFVHNKKLITDLLEMALFIEPEFTALAAEKATPKNIEEMTAIFNRSVEDLDKYHRKQNINIEQLLKNDIEFHKSIIKSCNNAVMDRLFPLIIEKSFEWYHNTLPDCSHHKMILDAICNRDSVKARESMRLHIEAIKKTLLTAVTTC